MPTAQGKSPLLISEQPQGLICYYLLHTLWWGGLGMGGLIQCMVGKKPDTNILGTYI